MATPEPDSPGLEKRPSAAEIARDWGTSRAYVSKLIKRGCPTDTLETARAWRAANAKYGVGYRSKSSVPPAPAPAPPAPDQPPIPPTAPTPDPPEPARLRAGLARDLSTVDQSLLAAIQMEQEAHRLAIEAHLENNDALLAIRIQSYNKARDGRLDAERMVMEHREKAGELVSLETARELIRKAWSTHVNRLRSLPKRAALKVNPADDVRAEQVLVEEIEAVIAETRKEFEA